MENEIIYRLTNRDKRREPKRGRGYWCWHCDSVILRPGENCRCGWKAGKKRRERWPTPVQ